MASAADWPQIVALRTRVFVEEQGVPADLEQDEVDATAVHAVGRDDEGRVVATGRMFTRDGRAVIGRMAVDASARGSGHGAAALEVLHAAARAQGHREVEIHAQVTARRFWERAGYVAVGEEFPEAGIAHVTMRRAL